jgi:hypothetical protein
MADRPGVKWSDITNLDSFKNDTPEGQEKTRTGFFEQRVAPNLAPDRVEIERKNWDSATLPRPAAPAPGVAAQSQNTNLADPKALARPTTVNQATPQGQQAPAIQRPKGEAGFVSGVADFGRAVVKGAVEDVPKAIAGGIEAFNRPQFDEQGRKLAPNALGRATDAIKTKAEELGAGWQQSEYGKFEQEKDAFDLRGAAYGGGESMAMSFGPALVGGILGGLLTKSAAGAAKGAAIAQAATLPVFFGSAYQDTYSRVYKDLGEQYPDLTEEQVHDQAVKAALGTGSVEAGGEAIADVATNALFKNAPGFVKKNVAKALTRGFQGAVPLLKGIGRVLGTEVGTELLQGAAQAEIEQSVGVGEGATWENQKGVIVPTMIMAMVGGGAAAGVSANQRYRTAKLLQNPKMPPEERQAAVNGLAGMLNEYDPEVARMFHEHSSKLIAQGKPVIVQDDRFYSDLKPLDQREIDKDMAAGNFTEKPAEPETGANTPPNAPISPSATGAAQPGEPITTPPPTGTVAQSEIKNPVSATPATGAAPEGMSRPRRQILMAEIDAGLKVARAELKAAQAAGDFEAATAAEEEIRAIAVNIKRVTKGENPLPTPRQQAQGQTTPTNWASGAAQEGQPKTVLQNRDRSTPAMIEQMTSIAANPDPKRLGFSRDFGNGAPVIEPGALIPDENMGKTDTATTAEGRQIPVQYAVVEAEQLLPSNRADGTPIAEYAGEGVEGLSRAIAGNGRIAGLQRAHESGTAAGYIEGIANDEGLHGVPAATIRAMKQPVLVRIMPQEEVTDNIGDDSNIATSAALPPGDQARTDIRRIDATGVELNAKGEPTPNALMQFVNAMPGSERSGLMTGDRPSTVAETRLKNAIFAQAYESDELIKMSSEAPSPDSANVIGGMRIAAGKMARLAGVDPGYDIRPIVIEAAEAAVNAARSDLTLEEFLKQPDMGRTPYAQAILEMMATNIRSAKKIGDALSNLADVMYDEATKETDSLFGQVDKTPANELLEKLYGKQPTGKNEGDAVQTGRPDNVEGGDGGGIVAPVTEGAGKPTDAGKPKPNSAPKPKPKGDTQEGTAAPKPDRAQELRDKIKAKLEEERKKNEPATPEPTPEPAAAPRSPDYGSTNTLVSAERAEELRKKLRAKLNGSQLNAGIDPEMLAIGTELAVFHIEAGTRKFTAFAKAMANDLGATLAQLKPYLRSWYNGARDMMEDSGLNVEGMDSPEQVSKQISVMGSPNAAEFELPIETEAELSARLKAEKDRADQDAKAQAKQDKEAADAKQAEDDKKRADETSKDFQLGQDAEQQMSGQANIFDIPPGQNPDLVKKMNAQREKLAKLRDLFASRDQDLAKIQLAKIDAVLAGLDRAIETGKDLNDLPTDEAFESLINQMTKKALKMRSQTDADKMAAEIADKVKAKDERLKTEGDMAKPFTDVFSIPGVDKMSAGKPAKWWIEIANSGIDWAPAVAYAEKARKALNERGVYDSSQASRVMAVPEAELMPMGRVSGTIERLARDLASFIREDGRQDADSRLELIKSNSAILGVDPSPVIDPTEAKEPVKSNAPEHRAVGVDDRELGQIVKEFNSAQAQGQEIHHLFDAPAKKEIVRLADKVKVYHAEHGWMKPADAKKKIEEWKANAKAQGKRGGGRVENSQKVVLSFFDLTGKWSQPWEEAGYQVWRFDIQNDEEMGDVNNFSAEFFGDWFGDFDGNDVYAILAACPCTDFASSGARHFAAKDEDGRTVASVKLVHQTLAAIEYFKPSVWAIENPVGRIESLGGLPPWRLAFDPNHLGETYTKKTLIWGRFNADLPIAPVDPVEASKMHSQYGGSSIATKNARSATPEGFSYGFFAANNAIDNPVMALANKFDRLDRDLIGRALSVGVTEEEITSAVEDFYYMDLDDDAANAAIQELIDDTGPAAAIDAAAHEAATSPNNDLPQPTDAQKEAGNYKKGHISVQGIDITVENPKGSERTGTDEDGTAWSHTMQSHYGYIKRTEGADGDHIDVFVGQNPESDQVYVVDQVNGKGAFDEHKVMLGFDTEKEAIAAYKENYDPKWTVGPVSTMSMDVFKGWLEDADLTKPISPSGIRVLKADKAFQENQKKNELAIYEQPGMTLRHEGKSYPVDSLADAATKYRAVIDRLAGEGAGGASQMGASPTIHDASGKQIARISYNGRIWDMNDKELPGPYARDVKVEQITADDVSDEQALADALKDNDDQSIEEMHEWISAAYGEDKIPALLAHHINLAIAAGVPEFKIALEINRLPPGKKDDFAVMTAIMRLKNEYKKEEETNEPTSEPGSDTETGQTGQKTGGRTKPTRKSASYTFTREDQRIVRRRPNKKPWVNKNSAKQALRELGLEKTHRVNGYSNSGPFGREWWIEPKYSAFKFPYTQDQYRNAKDAKTEDYPYVIEPRWDSMSATARGNLENELRRGLRQWDARFTKAEGVLRFGSEDQRQFFIDNAMNQANPFSMLYTKSILQEGQKKAEVTEPATDDKKTRAQELRAKIKQGLKEAGGGKEALTDFGEKLGGSRADKAAARKAKLMALASMDENEIQTKSLSDLWPKDAYMQIEDDFISAFNYVARKSVPKKPRKSWKLRQWAKDIQSAAALSDLLAEAAESGGYEQFRERMLANDETAAMLHEVDLLTNLPRKDWERIGVAYFRYDAYTYKRDENGDVEKIPKPYAGMYIDGKYHEFKETKDVVADHLPRIQELLGVEVTPKSKKKELTRYDFEVRGRAGKWNIYRKGDSEYRKLLPEDWTDSKELQAWKVDNIPALVEAWEKIKERDNVGKGDMRRDSNKPRTGKDHRGGKDIDAKDFHETFGFRGGEFGKWVKQGTGAKDRQGLLNQSFDALMDLADILGVPPMALSLNGSLGIGLGSRGSGKASAHFEPDFIVINLTKTKGAGSLAHEWFHAADNYFARARGEQGQYITKNPMSREVGKAGVREEVERAFQNLRNVLNQSPMYARAKKIDKNKPDGYWSRIIERAARSFEVYIIEKMAQGGYDNDFLANVRSIAEWTKAPDRYPYPKRIEVRPPQASELPDEMAPITEAFDTLFETIEVKDTVLGKDEFGKDRLGKAMFRAEDDFGSIKDVPGLFMVQGDGAKIDPEMLAMGAELAMIHMEGGGKPFPEFVQLMAEDLGVTVDQIKPYLRGWYNGARDMMEDSGLEVAGMDDSNAVREAMKNLGQPQAEKPAPAETAETAEKPAAKDVRDYLFDNLAEITDNRKLKSLMATFHGTPAADVTEQQMKEAQEAVEVALVKQARDTIAKGRKHGLSEKAIYDRLVDQYNAQPNLNMRSSTSMENQAYSTPSPLAFIASRYAGINAQSKVLEPTAGNGMLLIEATPGNVIANELNNDRADNLKFQGYKVTQHDASKVQLPAQSVDAFVTNPPFGRLRDENGNNYDEKVDGYTIKSIDQLIVAKQLDAMKDSGGKAAIIIGADKVAGEISPSDRVFFNWLYGHYNVVDHFEVAGELYQRQGAGWPVRVIIVEGRQKSSTKSPISGSIERLDNWNQIYDRYAESLGATNPRPDTGSGIGTEPVTRPNTGTGQPQVTGGEQTGTPNGSGGRPGGGSGNTGGSARPVSGGNGSGNKPGTGNGDDGRYQPVTTGEPGGVGLEGIEQPEALPLGTGSDTGSQQPVIEQPDGQPGAQPTVKAPRVAGPQEDGSSFQTPYPGRSKSPNESALVPNNMAKAIGTALETIEEAVGKSLDEYVMEKLQYDTIEEMSEVLMGLQIDAIAATIYNFENKGKGIIIADQTGVGKGRQAAAIIRYAKIIGKTPIFATVADNLYSDMWDDLHEIGETNIRPLVINNNVPIKSESFKGQKALKPAERRKALDTILKTGSLPANHDMLFMTYHQIKTDNEQRKVIDALKHNAIFVLDESHNVSGPRSVDKKVNGKKVTRVTGAGFMFEQIADAPVLYLSATYAKRADNMAIYYRTDLMDAVDSPEDLIAAVAAGGVPVQQIMSNMLTESGQLFRREKSFEGISIPTVIDTANREKHVKTSDAVNVGLQSILEADRMFNDVFFPIYLKEQEKKGGSAFMGGNKLNQNITHTGFNSVVHNKVRQMLLALKTATAVDRAIQAHKDGKKPVIALESTFGSFLSSYVKQHDLKAGDPVDIDYRDILREALTGSRRITVEDEFGEKQYIQIQMHELDPATRLMYQNAEKAITALDIADLPISPIDYMINGMEKAGIKVKEITGRELRLDYSGGGVPTLVKVPSNESSKKRAKVDDFNRGDLDALILNVSGSTGLSIHASKKDTVKDKKPRKMIVAQAMQDINILIQMLGRINRTGQVVLPEYEMLTADLPAEKRPAAVVARKMASLNANTSSNDESDTTIKAPDMMNKYGDQIVNSYLQENLDLAWLLHITPSTGDGAAAIDLALKATGRLAVLPVAVQEAVYEELERAYADEIEYLNATGQNDLIAQTVDLDARIKDSRIIYQGKAPDTIFGGNTTLHKIDAKYQGKPPTARDVEHALDKSRGETSTGILDKKNADKSYEKQLEQRFLDAQADLVKHNEMSDQVKTDELDAYAIKGAKLAERLDAARGAANAYVESKRLATNEIEKFTVGKQFRLDLSDEIVIGVVVSVKDSHADGKGNPWSLSKTRITFMVNSGIRQVELPLSKLQSEGKILIEKLRGFGKDGLDQIFTPHDTARREQRHVATGNLISGMANLDGGRIVNFTDNKGETYQGILMPRKFGRNGEYETAGGQNTIPVRDPAVVKKLLRDGGSALSGAGGVFSGNQAVRLIHNQGQWVVQVPKSNKDAIAKSVKFDEAIRKIVGDFYGSGNVMTAKNNITVADARLDALVDRLMELTPLYVMKSMEAQAIKAGNPPPSTATNTFDKDKKGPAAPPSGAFRADEAPRSGARVTRDGLERLVKSMGAQWQIPMTVMDSVKQLPSHVRGLLRDQGITGEVTGYYDRDNQHVYLIANGISSYQSGAVTLLHEAIGHLGIERVMGEDLDQFLKSVHDARNSDPAIAAAWAYAERNYPKASKAVKASETIARLSESDPKHTIVQRAIQIVRQILRKLGFTVQFSNNDIIEAFRRAKLALQEGQQYAGQGERGGLFRIKDDNGAGSPIWRAAKNKGLDLSKDARLARARDMGFDTDTVWYHGTTDNIAAFEDNPSRSFGIHVGTKLQANNRLLDRARHDRAHTGSTVPITRSQVAAPQDGANVIPVYIAAKKLLKLHDVGPWHHGPTVADAVLKSQFAPESLREAAKKIKEELAEAGKAMAKGKELDAKGMPTAAYKKLRGTHGMLTEMAAGRLRDAMIAAGYDGIQYGNRFEGKKQGTVGADSIIVFDPAKVRSINAVFDPEAARSSSILFRVEDADEFKLTSSLAPEFYSELTAAARQLKQEKGTPEQMLNAIKKMGGVKAEELEWSGLEEYMAGISGTITKQEIVDYLDANGVQVVTISKETPEAWVSRANAVLAGTGYTAEMDDYDNENVVFMDRDDESWEMGDLPPELQTKLDAIVPKGAAGSVKFSEHVLPGGTNYREVLLTLPAKPQRNSVEWATEARRRYAEKDITRLSEDQKKIIDRAVGGVSYNKSHWEEPNVIAHVRMNDRTDPEGNRVLFLEEIQSDWHQAGRKEGYLGTPTGNTLWDEADAAEEATRPDAIDEIESYGRLGFDRLPMAMGAILDHEDWAERWDVKERIAIEAINRWRTAKLAQVEASKDRAIFEARVPNAPFKNNGWVELAVKKILRLAAEGGYDRVAWTTGEQQNTRYNLSTQVKSIEWSWDQDRDKGYPDRKTIWIEPAGRDFNNTRIVVDDKGVVLRSNDEGGMDGYYDGKRLDAIVGKGMADKILENANGNLEGDGLNIGGEGMKGFYDNIVPSTFKKVARKLDKSAKIEVTPIGDIQTNINGSVQIDNFRKAQSLVTALRARGISAARANTDSLPGDEEGAVIMRFYNLTSNEVEDVWNLVELDFGWRYNAEPEREIMGGQMSIALTPTMQDLAISKGFGLFRVEDENKNPGTHNGKPFWIGMYNPLDGWIEEAHTYEEAQANDFHHSFTFSQTALDHEKAGDWRIFWINRDNEIEVEWRDPRPEAARTLAQLRQNAGLNTSGAFRVEGEEAAEAGGLTAAEIKAWRQAHKVTQRQGRVPEIQQAAKDLKAGNLKPAAYRALVKKYQPIMPIRTVPRLTTVREIAAAVATDKVQKHGILGYNKDIAAGTRVATRLDIPAYDFYDTWVVTIHDGSKRGGNAMAYGDHAAMKNVEFVTNPKAALDIATGDSSKAPFARIHGDWVPMSGEQAHGMAERALTAPGWTQVGMNPFRHSYFYDKATGEPVVSAEQVIQIGPLVMARNVVKGDPDSFKVGNTGVAFRVEDELDTDDWGVAPRKPWRAVLRDMIDRQRFQYQDKLIDLKRIQENADPADSANAYQKASIWEGKAGERLNDFDEQRIQPLLQAISDSGVEWDTVGKWLVARHAHEANAYLAEINPDMEGEDRYRLSGMSNEEADEILAENANHRGLYLVGDLVDQINKERVDLLIADGLISEGEAAAWRGRYQFYVPLKREEAEDANHLPGRGQGFNIKGKESKMRTGSAHWTPGKIVANVIAQHQASIIRAEKNKVGQALLSFVRQHPDPTFWTIDTERKIKVVRNGKVVTVTKGVDEPHELSVKINGVRHFIAFNTGNERAMRLVTGMKNLQAAEMGTVMRAMATATRYLSTINTSWNPEFIISNFARDVQTAAYNLSDTEIVSMRGKVLKDIPRAIGGIKRALFNGGEALDPEDEWVQLWEDFRKHGGRTGWIDIHADVLKQETNLKEMVERLDQGRPSRKWFTRFLKSVDSMNTVIENGVRLAAYANAIKPVSEGGGGLSKDKAAAMAKDLTVNFNRKGNRGAQVNALYMFFNASVQGNMRLIQAMVNSKQGRTLALATVGLAIGLDILNRAMSGDDDDDENIYDSMPDFVKDHNLIIMGEKAPIVKIPLPWGYNVLHIIGQSIGQAISGERFSPLDAASRVALGLMNSFNPIGGGTLAQTISPTIIDPITMIAENKNFMGTDLKPAHTYDARLPKPEYLMHWSTSREASQFITKWLNDVSGGNEVRPGLVDWSPEWVDLIYDTLTGGTGRTAAMTLDVAQKLVTGEEFPPDSVPFVRKVTGFNSEHQIKGRYYEWSKGVAYAKSEAKFLKGDELIAAQKNPEYQLVGAYTAAEKQLTGMRKIRREMVKNDAKQENIDALDARIRIVMARFNQQYAEKVLQ